MLKIKDIYNWAKENDLLSLVDIIDNYIAQKKLKPEDDEIKLWMMGKKTSWYGQPSEDNKVCKCILLEKPQENDLEGLDENTLVQFAKQYLNELENNAKAKSIFLHPDVARDLLAKKFTNQFFHGNFLKAKKWASDFVFFNMPLSGIVVSEELAKISPCIKIKDTNLTFTKGVIGALNEKQRIEFCPTTVEVERPEFEKRISKWRNTVKDCKEKTSHLKGEERIKSYIECMSTETKSGLEGINDPHDPSKYQISKEEIQNIGVRHYLSGQKLKDFVNFIIRTGFTTDPSYIDTWATRFANETEWIFSDLTRRRFLHEINPEAYKI